MGRPKSKWSQDAGNAAGEGPGRREFVGTTDAAALLGMSVSSVQKLVESGVLPGWRTQGGHRRIPMEAIKRELAKSRDAHAPAPAQVLRVLVVEDNAVICAAYAKMILQWGGLVEVSYAADGAQALLLLAQTRPDILITDLAMKPIDGRLLVQAIRANEQLAHLRVVVVSGVLDAERPHGFDARTVVYAKPLSFERLAGYLDAQVQSFALSAVAK
jgi:excisionase family DNA binding protein